MIPLWTMLAIPVLYAFLKSIFTFTTNLRNARKTGLPIVISPVSRINPLWMIFHKSLTPYLRKLPFGLGSFERYSSLSWYFTDKYHLHEELGKTFICVTPGMNEMNSVDPDVNAQIFARRNDFEKPGWILRTITLMGESITSVTGYHWQRHRRITTPPFNERNCGLIWRESLDQASQLGRHWSDKGRDGLSTLHRETMVVMLNILATSALGQSWAFVGSEDGESQERPRFEGDDVYLVYRSSLLTLVSSVPLITMTPLWVFKIPPHFIPFAALREYVTAHQSFRRILERMIEETRAELAAGKQVGDSTFLTAIVSKSEEFNKQDKPCIVEAGVDVVGGLSTDELMGNLFIFSFAGHETTAGTLNYALHLFAVYPETQSWVREEVDRVYQQFEQNGTANLIYNEVYPLLKRCLATMYETLRLYNPVNSVQKATVGPVGQEIVVDGKMIRIPPNTMTNPNVIGSATLPEYWGPDSMDWKPTRWIESAVQDEKTGDEIPGAESMRQPPKHQHTFIPWSAGARICPGQKFSRVEFVATVAELLRYYEVEVVPRPGETDAQARQRCLEVVQDSETQLTLRMRNPTAVSLRLVKR